jgi:hypothetical protein
MGGSGGRLVEDGAKGIVWAAATLHYQIMVQLEDFSLMASLFLGR